MVPPKSDQRWKQIVTNDHKYAFNFLPTQMLMMRVRLLCKDKTPQKIEQAVEIAYDFFSKNASIIYNDIEVLFGEITTGIKND